MGKVNQKNKCMKLYVKCSDGWVQVKSNSKDGVIPKEDVYSHLEIAGYNPNELEWAIDEKGIHWYCPCCGMVVGCLVFNHVEKEKDVKQIKFMAPCVGLDPNDIPENIQFDREVRFIAIDYPKPDEVIRIEPVHDLKGLMEQFKRYFNTWKDDESYQRCHAVDDYWIEGIQLRDNCAVIEIGS